MTGSFTEGDRFIIPDIGDAPVRIDFPPDQACGADVVVTGVDSESRSVTMSISSGGFPEPVYCRRRTPKFVTRLVQREGSV